MKKPRIHFSCLFGVDYELDLMPYWVDHWKSHKLDVYHIYLHREKGVIDPAIVDFFHSAGFETECVDGPHTDGILRRETVGRYAKNIDPEDFLVTADADEFHLIDYHDVLSKYDIVTGYMCDRYAPALQACNRDPFEQYFLEEEFTCSPIKNFTPPYMRMTEWPYTRRQKILACRAGDTTTYKGSHVMDDIPWQAKILCNQKVHHFAWRESARRKIAVKSYYKKENLQEIFGLHVPEEYLKQHSDLIRTDDPADFLGPHRETSLFCGAPA